MRIRYERCRKCGQFVTGLGCACDPEGQLAQAAGGLLLLLSIPLVGSLIVVGAQADFKGPIDTPLSRPTVFLLTLGIILLHARILLSGVFRISRELRIAGRILLLAALLTLGGGALRVVMTDISAPTRTRMRGSTLVPLMVGVSLLPGLVGFKLLRWAANRD
jgi:hypothetical protein